MTDLYKAKVDPLVAMKVVGHADYQTTANIYTHLDDEMLHKAGLSIDGVFASKEAAEKAAEACNMNDTAATDDSIPWVLSIGK